MLLASTSIMVLKLNKDLLTAKYCVKDLVKISDVILILPSTVINPILHLGKLTLREIMWLLHVTQLLSVESTVELTFVGLQSLNPNHQLFCIFTDQKHQLTSSEPRK